MNLFEKVQDEINSIDSDGNKKEIYSIGAVAELSLEVAWRDMKDRKEAEKVATKYRHGLKNGKGMVSGLPPGEGAMMRLSWSGDSDYFYNTHPDVDKPLTSQPARMREVTQNETACRIRVNKKGAFESVKQYEKSFRIYDLAKVVDRMFDGYDCLSNADISYSDNRKYKPFLSKHNLLDFNGFSNSVYRLMLDYINKTISLDKMGESNTYPDLWFEIVEIEPTKKLAFRNVMIDYPIEFEKTGKEQLFLSQSKENPK